MSTVADLASLLREHARERGVPALQAHVVRDGEVLLDVRVGPADARLHAFSLTKPLVASLVLLLAERGVIALDQPVSDLVPELDAPGLLIDHLLLHTAGFPGAPMRIVEGGDPVARRARFATWRLDSAPGERFAYHATSSFWVLGDLVERVTDRRLADLLAEEILGPLGLDDTTLGGGSDRVAIPTAVGTPAPEEVIEALLAQGIDVAGAVGEAAVQSCVRFAEEDVRAAGAPGAGLVTTARDLTRFHTALLAGRGPWSPATRQDLTEVVRVTQRDPHLGMAANRTRGFVVAGEEGRALRGFGDAVGPRAFGHTGAGGQVAWADPDTGTAACLLLAGIDRDWLVSSRIAYAFSTAAARLAGD